MKIFENPAALLGRKLWIGAWLVGALIFLSYYVRIEYMPDFDVSALSFLLLAAALVGALFVVSISIFAVLANDTMRAYAITQDCSCSFTTPIQVLNNNFYACIITRT